MDDKKDQDLSWTQGLMDIISKDEAEAIGDNEIAVHRMDKSLRILEQITKGVNIKIDARKNDPAPSMGVISIMGKKIRFDDITNFLTVTKLVSNIDVYSENGAVVRIDFTFHGLTRKGGKQNGLREMF